MAAMQSLVRRHTEEIPAVDGISLILRRRDRGLSRPNGGQDHDAQDAFGLLYPTAGELTVLGYVPWKRERRTCGKYAGDGTAESTGMGHPRLTHSS